MNLAKTFLTVGDLLSLAETLRSAPDLPILAFDKDGNGFELLPWREGDQAYLLKCPDREALHLGLGPARPWKGGQ